MRENAHTLDHSLLRNDFENRLFTFFLFIEEVNMSEMILRLIMKIHIYGICANTFLFGGNAHNTFTDHCHGNTLKLTSIAGNLFKGISSWIVVVIIMMLPINDGRMDSELISWDQITSPHEKEERLRQICGGSFAGGKFSDLYRIVRKLRHLWGKTVWARWKE